MTDVQDATVAQLIASLTAGSVVAAAGCGKTEQIALATLLGTGRRLILTHTHAGVDALRKRLKDRKAPSNRYFVDTIGGWSFRYAASYPKRSGLAISEPKNDTDWPSVYEAAARLIGSGAVTPVLTASYSGVYVDEYQDCDAAQHAVVKALARHLPVCVLGDPLQAIFDFKGQAPVGWQSDVFPAFPRATSLTKPWRWHKANNADLASWLERVRCALENGQELDFRKRPSCVTWKWLPDQPGPSRGMVLGTCKAAMSLDGYVVVIADPANLDGRALIAKGLAKYGFSNIEPLSCKTLFALAKKMEAKAGPARLRATLAFLERCMSNVGSSRFEKAVTSRKCGGKLGTAEYGDLIELGVAVDRDGSDQACLDLVDSFSRRPTSHAFRREMLWAMRSALRMRVTGQAVNLTDALWHVQNHIRHAGRKIPRRGVGSTLLVKGLEFEHAIVIHSDNMNRNDWYVALTRATRTLTVLSPSIRFSPAD